MNKYDGFSVPSERHKECRYSFRLLHAQLLFGITHSNEGAGHSPSMARDAAPAASMPQVVGPVASFELRDTEESVALAVMNASPAFLMY